MKHLFIVNPAAGKGKGIDKLVQKINIASKKLKVDAEVHITTCVGDAETFVRAYCNKLDLGQQVRIYACGGDGTLNEVVNGFHGFMSVEAACIPIGSGNDYIRNFDGGDPLDIEAQIKGSSRPVDLLMVTELDEDKPNTRYCVNMFNIGFDSNVVFRVGELKKIPLLTGSMAYLLGVFITLVKKDGVVLKVTFNDGQINDGGILQMAIANGCYCGGGVKGVPLALLSDGLLDVSIVKDISRIRFLSLFPKYKKGTHLAVKGIEKILTYKQCKSMVIEPTFEKMRLCTDGEISESGAVRIEIIPFAMNFIVPASS